VGYVFLYREGYAETEKGVGHVISRVNGSTYSMVKPGEGADDQMPVPRPWDAIDAAVPALENGAAFIGTTIHITPKQRQMPGSNPNTYCDVDAQCAEPEVRKDASTATKQKRHELNSCVNTHCWQMLWSPAYPLETEEHALETANQLTIRLQPAITFPGLDESVTFQSINVGSPTTFAGSDVKVDPPLPTPGSDDRDGRTSSTVGGHNEKIPDLYKIDDLLQLAGTSYSSIQQSGCTLSVEFIYDCFVDSGDCQPKMTVTRLDDNERHRGFHYQYAHYYRVDVDGKLVAARDLYTAYGVRLLLSSQGKGKKVSLSIIVLQIAAAIALLWLAGFVADFLMLYVLPERKHYRTYKQERTPDFSDLRNKIDEVEGEKKKLRDRKNRFAAKLDES